MLSPLTQTSAASGVWDFDLLLEEAFFSVTEVYYLEATIDLTFANTGALTTKRLTLPMMMLGGGGGAQKKSLLRAEQQQHMELMLVSRDGGSSDAGSAQTGVLSEKFQLRSAASAGGATTARPAVRAAAVDSNDCRNRSRCSCGGAGRSGNHCRCADPEKKEQERHFRHSADGGRIEQRSGFVKRNE